MAVEVQREQSFTLLLQLDLLAAEDALLLAMVATQAAERLVERVPEPLTGLGCRHPQRFEFGDDRVFEVCLPPANGRVIVARPVVGAAVVSVQPHATILEFPADAFAGDHAAAVFAQEQSVGEGVGLALRTPILALEQAAAELERMTLDQRPMLAGIDLALPDDVANIKAVGQHVRDAAGRHSRRAGSVDVALAMELLADHVEGHAALGVELEHAHHQLGPVGIELYRLVAVIAVHVAVRHAAWHPPLSHLLFLALADLLAEVVAVVLADRGHDVERQRTGRAGTELVVDEDHFHANGILEFLHSHGVAHVPADAVELVGEDAVDFHASGVFLHPLVHLIEGDALRATTSGLGDDKLSQHFPSLALGLVAVDANLRIERVAFGLLA